MKKSNLFVFLGGYCAVQKNGKYGLIDKNNNVIIPFKYDRIEIERDGYDPSYFSFNGHAEKTREFGILDGSGNVVVP